MPVPARIQNSVALLALCAVAPAAAQVLSTPREQTVSIALSIGTTAFSGAARGMGDEGERLRFAPYRPTMYGIHLGYGTDAFAFEATARVGEPGLAVRGTGAPGEEGSEGLLIVIENALRVHAFTGGASMRLARLHGGPDLRVSAAALVERWSSPEMPARTIAGGEAGLAMAVSLTRNLQARAEGRLGFTPTSPFRSEDLPEGFSQSTTWRRSLGVAVSWRL